MTELQASANYLTLSAWGDDHSFHTPYNIANGGWHHAVLVYDGSVTVIMYLDGQSLGTQTLGGTMATALNGNGVVVGRNSWDLSGGLYGQVQEVAIYPRALTAAQVAAHFNTSGNSRPTAPAAVTATSAQSNQATVTWSAATASAGAPVTSYVVQAFNGSSFEMAIAAGGSQTSATLNGLPAGANYTFTVAAGNNFGMGSASAPSASIAVGGSASTYSLTVLGDTPSMYYRLGEPSGSPLAADSSGNGRTGLYQGTAGLGNPGALVSDATTSFGRSDGGAWMNYGLGTGAPLGSTARSVEAWFKTTDTTDTMPLVGWGVGSTCNRCVTQLQANANNLILSAWGDDHSFHTPYSLATGGWHHAVMTIDANVTVTMYLDGQSLGTQTLAGTNATALNGNGVVIGRNSWDLSGALYGQIQEVAIYGQVLSATQVSAHFNASGHTLSAQPSNVVATAGVNQATVTWSGAAPFGYYDVSAIVNNQPLNSVAVGPNDRTATVLGLTGGTSYTFRVTAVNTYTGNNLSATSSAVTPTGGPAPYVAAVMADSPAVYYRLSETTGYNAADSSGNGRDATMIGTVSFGMGGALPLDYNHAAAFGGGGDLESQNIAGLPTGNAARSMDGWFKTTSSSSMGIFGYGAATSNGAFDLLLDAPNRFKLHTYAADPTFTTPNNVNDGAWHYVAVNFDGSTIIVYLDGSRIGSYSGGLSTQTNSVGFAIGRQTVDSPSYFNGSIGDVALYPSALPASRVAAHWQAAGWVPGAPTGVTAEAGQNAAVVKWAAPAYAGAKQISNYVVTALAGTTVAKTKMLDGNSNSANFDGLSANQPYSFKVTATNQYGSSADSNTTVAVTPTAPAMPASGATNTLFGNYLGWRASNMPPFPAGTFVIESKTNLPAMANWTVEFWMRNFSSGAVTYSGAGIGIMGGSTPSNPQSVTAGLGIDSGGGYFANYPGGSQSFSSNLGRGGSPWTHFAISYDGSIVRAFVNGQLQTSVATTTAALTAGPAGIYDSAGIWLLQLDELRISNVAEYTANFTPPSAAFPSTDGHTTMLWHFDDYGITRIIKKTVDSSVLGATYPNLFYDSSGNGAHGQLFMSNNNSHCCNQEIAFYSLGQGPTMDELDASGSCWLCNHPQSHTDWPVNTATGEFWHNFDDIAIPARGIPIGLNRSYGSLHAATDSPFGFGWSYSYGMSVTIDPNTQNATVRTSTGAGTVFSWNATTNQYVAQPRTIATFVKNADGTYTLTQKDRSKLNFNASGQLISEVDKDGYATTLAYDGSNHLHSVTDSSGRSLVFTWTGTHITGAADSAGRSVFYAYDSSGNLQQVTDIGGGVTTFAYDSSHHLTVMKDPVCYLDSTCPGVVNQYSGGQVTQQTDPLGRVTKFSYGGDILGTTTTITDPKGYVTVEEYLSGLLMTTTKAKGTGQESVWTTNYDPVTLATTGTIDPLGNTTTSTYDAQGNMLTRTDTLGRTTTYADYTTFNLPQHVTDASGVTTTYAYDTGGHLTSTSRPLVGSTQTATTSYAYDPAKPGDITGMTDANGKQWQYSYDANGYRNSSTDPLGNKSTSAYDSIGRLQSTVSPKGNVTGGNPTAFTTTSTTDAYGKPLTVTDPLGHQTVHAYNKNEAQTYLRDGNGHETRYVYDNDGELVNTQRPDLTSVQTSYDANGNVYQQIDPLSHATTYAYDGLNQKISMTDAINRATTYGYDLAGNMTSVKDARGQTSGYLYDAGHQLVAVQYSDGATPNMTYAYDPLGQRTSMTDGTGATSYVYDSLHRLTQNTNGAGARVGYGYDLKGQLTSLTYPGMTGTVTRTYDAAGHVTAVGDWLSHSTAFKYDGNSNLTEIDYANQTVACSAYNNADQLTGIVDTLAPNPLCTTGLPTQFLAFTYTRDNKGQLTGDSSSTPPTFGYDSLDRQTSGPGNMAYSYDSGDRITGINVMGGNQGALAYDNGDQLQSYTITSGSTQVQKYTYTFDANGNRTSRTDASNTTVAYGWDQANRMVSYGTTATYAYNSEGLRMSKTVNGATESFTWDVAEGLAFTLQDGNTSFVTGPGGRPLEQVVGMTVLYFHQDQLGSTRALTDSTGTVQLNMAFDAYGNSLASSGSTSTPLRYAGQYVDVESGSYYLRARYLDPTSSQFLSVDPARRVTRQAYSYTSDAPLNSIDPFGLSEIANDSGATYRPAVDVLGIVASVPNAAKAVAEHAAKEIAYQSRSGKWVSYYRASPMRNAARTLGRWDLAVNIGVSVLDAYAKYGGDLDTDPSGSLRRMALSAGIHVGVTEAFAAAYEIGGAGVGEAVGGPPGAMVGAGCGAFIGSAVGNAYADMLDDKAIR